METEPHYHYDRQGILVRCYRHCTNLFTDYRFWIGVTLSYPLEHYLWEHVWPFYTVMHMLTG